MLPWGAGPASGWGPHPLRCHRPGSGLGSLERLPRLLAARCMGCMRPLNAARAAPCLPVQPRWPHPSCLPEHHRSAGDIPAGFLLGWGGPSTWLWNSYWLPRRSPIKAVTPCWGLQRSTTTAATERFLEAACRARGWLSTGQPWQSAMEPEPWAGTTRQSDVCVCVCVRACLRACVRVCLCVRADAIGPSKLEPDFHVSWRVGRSIAPRLQHRPEQQERRVRDPEPRR